MALHWLKDWNKKNPKNIFGPGIVIGAVGGAVLVATLIVTWGWPYAVASVQTGPRGTGMHVAKTPGAGDDPTLADFYTEAPYKPEGGETLARDAYENVQVLGDLTEDNFNRLMLAMTEWVSPEQGCAYCHNEENLAADDVYTKVVSRRMIQMTQALNDDWGGHTNVSGEAGVNCFTCHRGENVPSNIWFDVTPAVETMSGWSAVQNRVTTVSGSTSLPSDALQKLLVEDGIIKVHDLDSRVPNRGEGLPTWQDTERTFSLMNYFSNSLNANCTFCHNTRAFYDGAQVTPQWATAFLGIDMVKSMNNEWLIPLADTLPPNRLGPVHGDAPKAACATCHKGYTKPLNGANMIVDWPELAAPVAPEYE